MAIHVAITRRVRKGHEAEFQKALREFLRDSLASEGVLGVHMLTPAPDDATGESAGEYGILRTFADAAERDAFYASPLYAAWLERVAPLVDGDCERRELTGLEAWFRGTTSPMPPRWKMAVATLCGVYPTSLLLSVTVADLVHAWPFLLRQLAFAASMVAILTWLVMPNVTRALRGWLHAR
jgi:antibiotic biosynthesis monooxygenase (ABM) superfamily enzyme